MRTDVEQKIEAGRGAPPGTRRFGLLGLVLVVVLMVAFAIGYMPRRRRQTELRSEATSAAQRNRRVHVVPVSRSASRSDTTLPGTIQAMDETAIYARADGYLKRRLADIGDHVRAGQVLAEIETPELDQQVRQARAALEQTRAAVLRQRAALGQAQANLNLASLSVKRWNTLVARGVLSRQEGDQRQSEFDARQADVHAAEAAVTAAGSDVDAASANVQRLLEMQSFHRVTAPFAGVITARNVDTGTLISAGGGASARALFNLAQIDRLRIYINLPQAFASSVRPGRPADVMLQELPGRSFRGTVTRTANSLDERSHTLLTEVQVPNPQHELLPGMYAQVKLTVARVAPPLVIPADTLLVHPDGSLVLVVTQDGKVHPRRVTLARDYGATVEISSGLTGDERMIVNPTDDLREGDTVDIATR
jgi:RND family efflux transporter MFP subunit